ATWINATSGINLPTQAGGGDNSPFYPKFIMDPSNSSRLLLGTDRIYETTDKANNWTSLSAPGANGWNPNPAQVTPLPAPPSNGQTIYAAAGGHIFVTTNDGGAWTQVDIPGATDVISDLMVDPVNSQLVYASRGTFDGGGNTGHVFMSNNGGT